MNDLASRLEQAASLIKHSDEIGPDQLDWFRSLFKEASYKMSILENLLKPMTFSYEPGLDGHLVKTEAEIPRECLAELLQFLGENMEA